MPALHQGVAVVGVLVDEDVDNKELFLILLQLVIIWMTLLVIGRSQVHHKLHTIKNRDLYLPSSVNLLTTFCHYFTDKVWELLVMETIRYANDI